MTMLKIPGMLLIGSAGPNAGKTHFACALIEKFRKVHKVIAIKVTTITEKDGNCPRGGRGCGVCASINGNFSIIQETEANSGKDTSRLLAAGASRVLWLRTLKGHLGDAATALLDVTGADSVSICESNSLRFAVEPSAFVMMKQRTSNKYKSSAKAVAKYVDRIVSFDPSQWSFDLDPQVISLIDGKWIVPLKATAIIMAGGPSSRMGTDKAMLLINPPTAETMIGHIYNQLRPHFDQILISAGDQSKYSFLGADVVPDKVPGQGPLGGIASALTASANELNFVIACDIPKVDINFVKTMLAEARDCDAVIPTRQRTSASSVEPRSPAPASAGVNSSPRKRGYEPLFAVYKKNVVGAMNDVLASGKRRIIEILTRCKVKFINIADAEWFANLNTMTEYRGYVHKQHNKV